IHRLRGSIHRAGPVRLVTQEGVTELDGLRPQCVERLPGLLGVELGPVGLDGLELVRNLLKALRRADAEQRDPRVDRIRRRHHDALIDGRRAGSWHRSASAHAAGVVDDQRDIAAQEGRGARDAGAGMQGDARIEFELHHGAARGVRLR
ncbi:MAG: hypothetical protein ACK55I_19955, partial [bacterium]